MMDENNSSDIGVGKASAFAILLLTIASILLYTIGGWTNVFIFLTFFTPALAVIIAVLRKGRLI